MSSKLLQVGKQSGVAAQEDRHRRDVFSDRGQHAAVPTPSHGRTVGASRPGSLSHRDGHRQPLRPVTRTVTVTITVSDCGPAGRAAATHASDHWHGPSHRDGDWHCTGTVTASHPDRDWQVSAGLTDSGSRLLGRVQVCQPE